MSYVDGCVAAVPTVRKAEYLQHAKRCAEIFKEFGATRVVECWGANVPHGQLTDYYRAVQAKDDETIVFSWIEWPSKAVWETATPKIMSDPRLSPESNPMPFDGKRMIFGGFEVIFDL